MWAKIIGLPCRRPLKARTLPLEGNGDCSGILTFAAKLPSPTREERQAASASLLVEGAIHPRRQRGSPCVSSRPLRLSAMVSLVSLGGPPGRVEAIVPPKLTPIGAVPRRGKVVGVSFPLTEMVTPSLYPVSARPTEVESARGAIAAALSASAEIPRLVFLIVISPAPP